MLKVLSRRRRHFFKHFFYIWTCKYFYCCYRVYIYIYIYISVEDLWDSKYNFIINVSLLSYIFWYFKIKRHIKLSLGWSRKIYLVWKEGSIKNVWYLKCYIVTCILLWMIKHFRGLKSRSENVKVVFLNPKWLRNASTLQNENSPDCRNKPYQSYTNKAFSSCILIS